MEIKIHNYSFWSISIKYKQNIANIIIYTYIYIVKYSSVQTLHAFAIAGSVE